MSNVGQRKFATQKRVIQLFEQQLGYSDLGYWHNRQHNRNIETEFLSQWLSKRCTTGSTSSAPGVHRRGVSDTLINKTLRELDRAAALADTQNLYDANKAVYRLLRYSVKVKEGARQQTQTVWLIDWKHPENNHFAIAKEVTIKGQQDKGPDLVIYVNPRESNKPGFKGYHPNFLWVLTA